MNQLKLLNINYQTLLHVLPGLKTLSDGLISDMQEDESIETLKNRFKVLYRNIQEMSESALVIQHVPSHVSPLITALGQLGALVSSLVTISDDYEQIIQSITITHKHIIQLMVCVGDLNTVEVNSNNGSASPAALYAY